jgi:threonine dehydratase
VHSVVTVSEAEIIYWMRTFWERTKVLIEPSSAVALAAVFSQKFPTLDHPKNIGIVLGGGNVDLDHLPWQTP